jgi:membrane dipeptidase
MKSRPTRGSIRILRLIPFLSLICLGECCFGQDNPPSADTYPILTSVSCAVANDQPRSDFRVKLRPAQEKRALKLYKRAIIITAHDHCVLPDDFRDQQRSGITVRVVKPITDGYYREGAARFPIQAERAGWEARSHKALALMHETIANSQGQVVIIQSVQDILRVKREHKSGVILSFEGARPLQGKLENVVTYHQLGLRELQLFWGVPNPLKDAKGQLNAFGEDVVREMDRVGVVLDIGHMPEASFLRALAATKNPFVTSHCMVAFCERNTSYVGADSLDDRTIRLIAAHGGVMCVHFLGEPFIQAHHGTHPNVQDLVDHIDHIRDVAGIDYIGLGPDYSPMKGWRWIEGAERMEGMPNVVREMVRRGYTDSQIEKVLGLNLMRVYRQVWGQ